MDSSAIKTAPTDLQSSLYTNLISLIDSLTEQNESAAIALLNHLKAHIQNPLWDTIKHKADWALIIKDMLLHEHLILFTEIFEFQPKQMNSHGQIDLSASFFSDNTLGSVSKDNVLLYSPKTDTYNLVTEGQMKGMLPLTRVNAPTSFLVGTTSGRIYKLDRNNNDSLVDITDLNEHTGSIHSLSLSITGTRLVSSSKDCTVRLWDLSKKVPTFQRLPLPESFDSCTVKITPCGQRAVVVLNNGSIWMWDLSNPSHITVQKITNTQKTDSSAKNSCLPLVALSGDGSALASIAQNQKLTYSLLNDAYSCPVNLAFLQNEVPTFLALSHDGTTILLATSAKTIFIIKTSARKFHLDGFACEYPINSITPLRSDLRYFVVGCNNGQISLFDRILKKGRALQQQKGNDPVSSVAVQSNGRLIFAHHASGKHILYSLSESTDKLSLWHIMLIILRTRCKRITPQLDQFIRREFNEITDEAVKIKIYKHFKMCCKECKRYTKLLRCSGCQKVYYCSVDCQRNDRAHHKSECRK